MVVDAVKNGAKLSSFLFFFFNEKSFLFGTTTVILLEQQLDCLRKRFAELLDMFTRAKSISWRKNANWWMSHKRLRSCLSWDKSALEHTKMLQQCDLSNLKSDTAHKRGSITVKGFMTWSHIQRSVTASLDAPRLNTTEKWTEFSIQWPAGSDSKWILKFRNRSVTLHENSRWMAHTR